MRRFLALIVLGLLATPATAQPWYARGEFNGWSTGNQMVDQGGGHYTATISGLFSNTNYEYKLATSDWSTNYPGSNGKVTSNDIGGGVGEINFNLWTNNNNAWTDGWFPNNTPRVGYVDSQQYDWELIGSFDGWQDAANPTYFLTDTGNGVHHGQFALNAGYYEFKFRKQGDVLSTGGIAVGQDFGNSAANNAFRVWTNGDLWNFDLDLPNGKWRAYTTAPSPDLNNDGQVDASDYVLWRKNNGSAPGYNVWRAHFGYPSGEPFYVRGSFNGFGTGDQMVDQGGGHFTKTITGLTAGTDYEYKVARADFSGAVPGSNGKVRADASGNINFHFYEKQGATWSDGWSPDNTNRVGYDDPHQYGWEIVGAFNGWPGTNDPLYALSDQSSGLYTGSFTFATAGTYAFKFRQLDATNPWNTSIGDDFGNSAADNHFTVAANGDTWNFELDLPHGKWRAYHPAGSGLAGGAVPEPASLALAMFGLVLMGLARRR